jgi:ParB family chromosome partitioning protein
LTFHVERAITNQGVTGRCSTWNVLENASKGIDMTKRKDARRRLGRGLESLISAPVKVEVPNPAHHHHDEAVATATAPAKAGTPAPSPDGGVSLVAPDLLRPDPRQPRRDFDQASLERLAASIRTAGIMQPIVARPEKGGTFQIVAGERRWRAAGLVGLQTVPVIVREIDDRTAAELSLVENIQREDLNPIERANAFRRLIDEFGLTHQEIAERVGLDRSSVSNHLRLLELDEAIQDALRSGGLSMGHGRALLAITNIEERGQLAQSAVKGQWSVRELERRIRSHKPAPKGETQAKAPSPTELQMDDLQKRLGEHLGTKVQIRTGRKKGTGTLSLSFYSLDDFEGILDRLGFRYE